MSSKLNISHPDSSQIAGFDLCEVIFYEISQGCFQLRTKKAPDRKIEIFQSPDGNPHIWDSLDRLFTFIRSVHRGDVTIKSLHAINPEIERLRSKCEDYENSVGAGKAIGQLQNHKPEPYRPRGG